MALSLVFTRIIYFARNQYANLISWKFAARICRVMCWVFHSLPVAHGAITCCRQWPVTRWSIVYQHISFIDASGRLLRRFRCGKSILSLPPSQSQPLSSLSIAHPLLVIAADVELMPTIRNWNVFFGNETSCSDSAASKQRCARRRCPHTARELLVLLDGRPQVRWRHCGAGRCVLEIR